MNNFLNFTLGPVQTYSELLNINSQQIPYFRTEEFSSLMLENENMILELVNAKNSRVCFLTSSGTGAMEASICNLCSINDKLLIVNGGGFGQRFVDIAKVYNIPYEEIKLQYGETLKESYLQKYINQGFTHFLINQCETSTGVIYDLNICSDFCKKNNLIFIVDAISSFIAEPIDMENQNIDVIILSSHKALACAPGISIVILSNKALTVLNNLKSLCFYFNLKTSLDNGMRGQTPFTPSVNVLLQINYRLKQILNTGISNERNKIIKLATNFRNSISQLNLKTFPEKSANTLTAIKYNNAFNLTQKLKQQYNIYVCPNRGDLKNGIFRVGHIGNLTISDNNKLIFALQQLI